MKTKENSILAYLKDNDFWSVEFGYLNAGFWSYIAIAFALGIFAWCRS